MKYELINIKDCNLVCNKNINKFTCYKIKIKQAHYEKINTISIIPLL